MGINAKIGQNLQPFIGNGDVSSRMKNSRVRWKTPNKQTSLEPLGKFRTNLMILQIKTTQFIKRRCFFSLFYAPEIKDSVILSSSLKLLTLLITFEQWVVELWYFKWVFLVTGPFHGYHYFLPCNLDLEFDLFFDNFHLANNFWTVSARSLIS